MNVKKLKKLIQRHVDAQLDLSWKGGKDPSDWDYIDIEAGLANKKLNQYIKKLEKEYIALRIKEVDV